MRLFFFLLVLLLLPFALAAPRESLDVSGSSVTKLNTLFSKVPLYKVPKHPKITEPTAIWGWNVTFGPPLFTHLGGAYLKSDGDGSNSISFVLEAPLAISLNPPYFFSREIKPVDWILIRPKSNQNGKIELTISPPKGVYLTKGLTFDCYGGRQASGRENLVDPTCWIVETPKTKYSFKLVSSSNKPRVSFLEQFFLCPGQATDPEKQCMELAVALDGTLLPKVNGRTFPSEKVNALVSAIAVLTSPIPLIPDQQVA